MSARVELVEPLVFGKYHYAVNPIAYKLMLLAEVGRLVAIGCKDIPGVEIVEDRGAA